MFEKSCYLKITEPNEINQKDNKKQKSESHECIDKQGSLAMK